MDLIAPGAKLIVVTNTAGDLASKDGAALHVQVGNGSLVNEFNNSGAQASSTWWFAKNGDIEQYTHDPRIRMWAQGDGNAEKASGETEGYPGDPMTPEQVASWARVLRWARDTPELGWPLQLSDQPGHPGFGWHGEGCSPNWNGNQWGNHPYCPGDIRKGQRQAIIDIASKGSTTIPHPAPGKPFTFYNGGEHVGHPYPWDGKGQIPWCPRTMSLHKGSVGGPVKALQTKLHCPVTGVFDAATVKAVWGAKHGHGFAIDVPDPGADQHSEVVDWRLVTCL